MQLVTITWLRTLLRLAKGMISATESYLLQQQQQQQLSNSSTATSKKSEE